MTRDVEAAVLAVLLLFTTPPSDRALDGWEPGWEWVSEELDVFGLRDRIA